MFSFARQLLNCNVSRLLMVAFRYHLCLIKLCLCIALQCIMLYQYLQYNILGISDACVILFLIADIMPLLTSVTLLTFGLLLLCFWWLWQHAGLLNYIALCNYIQLYFACNVGHPAGFATVNLFGEIKIVLHIYDFAHFFINY
jgi:hypothetical protein